MLVIGAYLLAAWVAFDADVKREEISIDSAIGGERNDDWYEVQRQLGWSAVVTRIEVVCHDNGSDAVLFAKVNGKDLVNADRDPIRKDVGDAEGSLVTFTVPNHIGRRGAMKEIVVVTSHKDGDNAPEGAETAKTFLESMTIVYEVPARSSVSSLSPTR